MAKNLLDAYFLLTAVRFPFPEFSRTIHISLAHYFTSISVYLVSSSISLSHAVYFLKSLLVR